MKKVACGMAIAGFILLAACGGGGGGSGGGAGGNSSSTPIALYAYGDGFGSGNGNLTIDPVNAQGLVSASSQGPQTNVGPGADILISVSGARYLYVSNPNGGTNNVISYYSVNGSTVTSLGQITAAGNLAPQAQMVYTGGTLFVPLDNGDISSYAVNADGSLTLEHTSAYTVSVGAPLAMAVDATGKYLVVGEWASTTTWNALALTIGTGGTLTLSSTQTGISNTLSYIVPDPSTTNGDYLFGSSSGYLYEISLSSGGIISVTTNTSIPPNVNTETYPSWIDPTGSYIFLAECNFNTFAETLVQYTIDTNGLLTAGSMPPIQIATGSSGSVGGITSSSGFYDSANGMVVIPIGGYLTTYTYNVLNGYLTALSLRTGDAPSGIMAAYAP